MQLSIRLLLLAAFCFVLGVGCDTATTTNAAGSDKPGVVHQDGGSARKDAEKPKMPTPPPLPPVGPAGGQK